MNVQIRHLIVAILSFGIWSDVLLAESDETEGGYDLNTAGVFFGLTGEDRRDTGYTVALTYERHFSESFGLGLEVERVFGDLNFWVATVPFAYHFKAWKVFAGPGLEMPDDADNELLVRIGGEYAFEVGRWTIAPTLLSMVKQKPLAVWASCTASELPANSRDAAFEGIRSPVGEDGLAACGAIPLMMAVYSRLRS